jgi:hypothetical protein
MVSRAIIARVAVYLAALLVVIWLLRERDALLPLGDLTVSEVRQTEGWRSLRAGPAEKLLIVKVRIPKGVGRWKPAMFRLEDEEGRSYRPIDDSPSFRSPQVLEPTGPVEGILIFRLPATTQGKSLSMIPEGWDEADSTDHQREDTGQKGGP